MGIVRKKNYILTYSDILFYLYKFCLISYSKIKLIEDIYFKKTNTNYNIIYIFLLRCFDQALLKIFFLLHIK